MMWQGEKEEVEFAHNYFMRGQEHLLGEIKRKVNLAGAKAGSGFNSQFVPSIKSEKVTEVLSEVGALKERQEDIDNKLERVQALKLLRRCVFLGPERLASTGAGALGPVRALVALVDSGVSDKDRLYRAGTVL